jgi:predicted enzyme related to lactoylglutathione lyase
MSTAKLRHVAIVSRDYSNLGDFYSQLFGMKLSSGGGPGSSAVTVSDGYVGMNVNRRAAGRQGGLDHFGFEVENAEEIFARVEKEWPTVHYLKRPGNRPFAGISMHDPQGYVFDLSQRSMENRTGLYKEDEDAHARTPRHIQHIMLRALDPDLLKRFYTEVLELREEPKDAGDPNHYLTDGMMTMIIAPWQLADFAGSGIERPAMDHVGFAVESLERFRLDLDNLIEQNPAFAPPPLKGEEGQIRMNLLARCSHGSFQMSDPDGVLLDIHEAH